MVLSGFILRGCEWSAVVQSSLEWSGVVSSTTFSICVVWSDPMTLCKAVWIRAAFCVMAGYEDAL